VNVDLAPALPPITGDEAALRQVLVNLLTNAAKYGDGAPVLVTADADAKTVRIKVEDRGPGLPEADLEPIFDLFYRSGSNARRASGTGIGLYVVRQLVEAMGGTVVAYPVTPQGLGFLVELHAEPAVELEHAPARPSPFGGGTPTQPTTVPANGSANGTAGTGTPSAPVAAD
jgi:two-component system sensor histidine kinase KdpD